MTKRSKIDPLEYEEAYFKANSKQNRHEKKKAKNTDRSKYKKSNIDQRQKQEKEIDHKGHKQGQVITLSKQGYTVQTDDSSTFMCSLKGAMKKEKGQMKNLVVVGDHVYFEKVDDSTGVITGVKPRISELVRLDNLNRRKKQLIAANIDQVFITVSVIGPPLKPFLIDRYILAAIKSGITPIVLVNKVDYLDNRPDFVSDTQFDQDKDHFLALKAMKKKYPFKLLFVSCKTGEGIGAIKKLMDGKTSVFAGQSGTGKSSLLNTLLAETLEVGKIKEKTRKGSHTTTSSSLIPLASGGFCIDTPGIKSFGIWDLNKSDIILAFPDFTPFESECKFRACTHTSESGCAIKKAVDDGLLPSLRYTSYLELMQEENLPFWK